MEKNYVIDTYMELARRLGYKDTQVEEAVNELRAILEEKDQTSGVCSSSALNLDEPVYVETRFNDAPDVSPLIKIPLKQARRSDLVPAFEVPAMFQRSFVGTIYLYKDRFWARATGSSIGNEAHEFTSPFEYLKWRNLCCHETFMFWGDPDNQARMMHAAIRDMDQYLLVEGETLFVKVGEPHYELVQTPRNTAYVTIDCYGAASHARRDRPKRYFSANEAEEARMALDNCACRNDCKSITDNSLGRIKVLLPEAVGTDVRRIAGITKTHFEHNGVHYFMTPEEIEAAYRYQEKLFRLQDAKNHLDDLVFGVDPDAIPEDAVKEAIAEFEGYHNVRYSDVSTEGSLEVLAEHFLDNGDCNCAENDVWTDILLESFSALRRNGKGIHGSFDLPELRYIYTKLYEMNEETLEEDRLGLTYFQTEYNPDLLRCCTTVQSAREYISRLVSEILTPGNRETTRKWLVDAGADDELVAYCGLN